MEIKLLEIRDRDTFVPALAIRLGGRDERERWLLAQAGWGKTVETQRSYVLLYPMMGGSTGKISSDKFAWDNRTLRLAHHLIEGNFDGLKSGDVVDVERIS